MDCLTIYWSQIMGYIRKHKDGIRTGFELLFIMAGILAVSPIIIYLQLNSY